MNNEGTTRQREEQDEGKMKCACMWLIFLLDVFRLSSRVPSVFKKRCQAVRICVRQCGAEGAARKGTSKEEEVEQQALVLVFEQARVNK